MKFGKVEHPEKIDFKFPKVPDSSVQFLRELSPTENPARLYLGATGWSMKEWHGTVYPKSCKASDYLKFYSKQFSTIEFNTTHYRIPSPGMVEKWYESSAPDFKFCPKLPQSISHLNDLGINSGQLDHFTDVMLGFKEKMGCCFMQLPPYFGPDRRKLLNSFLDLWSSNGIALAIEFRHPDWFNSVEGKAIFDDLRQKGFGAVITDVAGRRDVLHLELTASFTMIRFVGNNLIKSDIDRMNAWVTLLNNWKNQGLNEIYFFPHQPDNIKSPQATVLLAQAFDQNNFEFRFPNLELHKSGEQMNLF